ncbi:MAG: MBL fold metallo-hydrolase [Methylococcaceae bacterium]|nr:MBL fold metallo-hydrolase [Methylococcaceae bacterium]
MSLKFLIIPVTAYQQNCTLLICEETNKAAIVDPGGDIDVILNAVETEGAILESILVTHGHLDHVGAVAELAKKLSLPIEGPQLEDKFWLDSIPSQIKTFGFPASEIFTPTRWLDEGDTVTVGKQELKVIHCPGHTPGHIVFFHPESRLALVGDVLFKESIGRTDFPKGNFDTLIHSIKNNLWPLGKEVRFIPGHGPMSTFGHEMQFNPYVSIK